MMAGFDERCPYCGADMECRQSWDYEHEYDRDCRSCGKVVRITVSYSPEFETSKPMCQRCRKVEVQKACYCAGCKQELDALSEHNKQRGT